MRNNGFRQLPEQRMDELERESEKPELEKAISEKFKALIDGANCYSILLLEDCAGARMTFAWKEGYDMDISVGTSFLGYVYAKSKNKKISFLVPLGSSKEIGEIYEKYTKRFEGHCPSLKTEEYGWQKNGLEEALKGLELMLMGEDLNRLPR